MIYFDNAATSFPKPKSVIKAVKKCLSEYCGNPSRSSHFLSMRSSEVMYNARCALAEFFSVKNEENVVFTHNATYALNIAIKTLIPPGSHVITSDIEHNSVIRVLEKLRNNGDIEYSLFDSSKDINNEISRLKRNNTSFVASTACSNVTGKQIDLMALSDACAVNNIRLIIDASQAAGHFPIDLGKIKCEALCAPGHKSLFGIQGSGFCIFPRIKPKVTLIEGGSGSDSTKKVMPDELPDMLEAGTQNVPACAALEEGIRFITTIGLEEIEYKIGVVRDYIKERLANIRSVSLLEANGPILAFNIANIPSSVVAKMLDEAEICTRSGLHCSPSTHQKLGTLSQGAVRLSFSYFNTQKEAAVFCNKMHSVLKELSVKE